MGRPGLRNRVLLVPLRRRRSHSAGSDRQRWYREPWSTEQLRC